MGAAQCSTCGAEEEEEWEEEVVVVGKGLR